MATIMTFLFLAEAGVRMKNVDGWQGMAIAVLYLIAILWDTVVFAKFLDL